MDRVYIYTIKEGKSKGIRVIRDKPEPKAFNPEIWSCEEFYKLENADYVISKDTAEFLISYIDESYRLWQESQRNTKILDSKVSDAFQALLKAARNIERGKIP